jgi:hypothetical protein
MNMIIAEVPNTETDQLRVLGLVMEFMRRGPGELTLTNSELSAQLYWKEKERPRTERRARARHIRQMEKLNAKRKQ